MPFVVFALVAALSLIIAGRGLADTSQASQSLALVNSTRAAHGLGNLAGNAGLNRIAQQHANEMAAKNEIYHYFDIGARADAAGVHWQQIGENVGVGANVQTVHDAFMQSAGHRANVLYAAYNVIGVGIAVAGDGSVFVAHEFAQLPSSSPARTVSAAPAVHHTAPVPTQAAGHAATSRPAPAKTVKVQSAPVTHSVAVTSSSAFPNALQDGHVNTLPL
jgi:hypothetical protein